MTGINKATANRAYGETISLGDDGKYRIEYTKNKEYEYRVMRYDEDVTREVSNNAFDLLFWELLKAKGLY